MKIITENVISLNQIIVYFVLKKTQLFFKFLLAISESVTICIARFALIFFQQTIMRKN